MSDFSVSSSWGLQRIAAERQRQISQEGFGPEHDDKQRPRTLPLAAACYAAAAAGYNQILRPFRVADITKDDEVKNALWPWPANWDKRAKHSAIRCLEIAGALIVAELDRRHRAGESGCPQRDPFLSRE